MERVGCEAQIIIPASKGCEALSIAIAAISGQPSERCKPLSLPRMVAKPPCAAVPVHLTAVPDGMGDSVKVSVKEGVSVTRWVEKGVFVPGATVGNIASGLVPVG